MSSIRDALGCLLPTRFSITEVQHAPQLVWCVLTLRPRLLIVDVRDRDGLATHTEVLRIREACPDLPILGFCGITPADARGLLALARAGIDDVVLRGFEDLRMPLARTLRISIRTGVDRAGWTRVVGRLERMLPRSLPRVPRAAVLHSLMTADRAQTVAGVSEAIGVHRRTLVRQFSGTRLPSPAVMFAWSRVLAATHALSETTRSVEQVAHALDFPSASALCNLLRRHTGLQSARLRAAGGRRQVLALYRRLYGGAVNGKWSDDILLRHIDRPSVCDDCAEQEASGG